MDFGISVFLSLFFAAATIALLVTGIKTKKRVFFVIAAFSVIGALTALGYGLLTLLLVNAAG